MKNVYTILIFFFISYSCAPVLSENLIIRGTNNVSLTEIKNNPSPDKGRLFILGGIIVSTTITQEGSLIEAIYVPVDSKGYLKNLSTKNGRYLALLRGNEILDPLIFREQREVTLAAEFMGTRVGKINEMDYVYPFFEIKEIYLWREKTEYDSPHYIPYPYYPYRYYDPFYPWRY